MKNKLIPVTLFLLLTAGAIVYVPGMVGRFWMVRSQEDQTLGNLGALRSALSIYYGDHETFPKDPAKDLVPKYIREIPAVTLAPRQHLWTHRRIVTMAKPTLTDSGSWGYITDPQRVDFGKIFVDCTHTDTRGRRWNTL